LSVERVGILNMDPTPAAADTRLLSCIL
jgi:hypothetical protein